MKKYFSMEKTEKEATINIYGDITSYPWTEGDVSAASLVHQLEALDMHPLELLKLQKLRNMPKTYFLASPAV